MPELAAQCVNLFGADVHGHADEVMDILARRSIGATLRRSSAGSLPFADAVMDVVVAASTLEFVKDLSAMSAEIAHVLKPVAGDGRAGREPRARRGLALLSWNERQRRVRRPAQERRFHAAPEPDRRDGCALSPRADRHSVAYLSCVSVFADRDAPVAFWAKMFLHPLSQGFGWSMIRL
ncbi:methyltransferase domain-containing protein [bacterium]|nr:MAG: methyltransferase domain-containing protein [bacterium]